MHREGPAGTALERRAGMGDLRMGSFHQMEGTIRGHLAEASRPAFRGDRFDEQKQAMINLGVPEAVAEDRAKALILFAEGGRRLRH